MIYLTKRYNKIGQVQLIKGLIGKDKYSFGHGIWVEIIEKINVELIEIIFNKYSIFQGYPLPTIVMKSTIINIYNNRNNIK